MDFFTFKSENNRTHCAEDIVDRNYLSGVALTLVEMVTEYSRSEKCYYNPLVMRDYYSKIS